MLSVRFHNRIRKKGKQKNVSKNIQASNCNLAKKKKMGHLERYVMGLDDGMDFWKERSRSKDNFVKWLPKQLQLYPMLSTRMTGSCLLELFHKKPRTLTSRSISAPMGRLRTST